MQFFVLCLKGLCIGASNVVPGISGGTIAVMLGIFDTLIYSINNFFRQKKKSLQFLLPIGLGMVLGIISLGSLMDFCLNKFSFQTGCFLAGLVAGSIPLIYQKIKNKASSFRSIETNEKRKIKFGYAFLGIIIVVVITIFKNSLGNTNHDLNLDLRLVVLLFFGGVLASATMIVPGISGAFVLMLLGLYSTVISAITKIKDFIFSFGTTDSLFELIYIFIPLCLGILIGIILMTKIIAYLLEKYFLQTYETILGLVIGTIYAILMDPLTHQSYERLNYTILFSGVGCFLVSILIVIKIK